MSRKIQVTVSDDLYEWLDREADYRSIKVATLATVLLGEARRSSVNRDNMQVMFERMRALSPEQFVQLATNGSAEKSMYDNLASAIVAESEKKKDNNK